MEIFICEYHTFDGGRHTQQVAEVFTSYNAYALWLVKQMRYPDRQQIEGKGKDLRLTTNFSDNDYTMYTLLVKTVLD